MKTVTLNDSEYWNDKLLAICKEIVKTFEPLDSPKAPIYVEVFPIEPDAYGYSIVMFQALGAYSIPEVSKWIENGDLADAIEVYHNVHKSVYGCRPSWGHTSQMSNIDWIRAETKRCVDAANSYQTEQEHINE